MMKNKNVGFTLIELLAVIVILAIVLAIAIPSITGVINSSKRSAFESDAKMLLQAIKYKKLVNENFNFLIVNKDNLMDLIGIDGSKYNQVAFKINDDNEMSLVVVGGSEWNGLIACGTSKNMVVVQSVDECGADLLPPTITLLGDNYIEIYEKSLYIDAGATATDNNDGDITNLIQVLGTLNTRVPGTYTVIYSVTDNSGNTASTSRNVKVIPVIYNYGYTGDYQTFTAPVTGDYKIELWGAGGGGNLPGKGAYTNGIIELNGGTTLYIYVGQKGTDGNLKQTPSTTSLSLTSFNGGGAGGLAGNSLTQGGIAYYYYFGNAGGGATDIRLISGQWNDTNSLRSRFIVAAGGGGGVGEEIPNGLGNAGGLIGFTGIAVLAFPNNGGTGGTQTTGYAFGIGGKGGNGLEIGCHGHNGGGGGYYGGNGGISTGGNCYKIGGGGGSSFISGYTGCNAINSTGSHTGQPNHYSGYVFNNSEMTAGNASMPSPTGPSELGHTGNGYARFSIIEGIDYPPTIAIFGNSEVTIEFGAIYTDEGATASDLVDGDMTQNIITTTNLNPNLAGTYTITYSITDSWDNTVITTRQVIVKPVVYSFEYTGNYQTFTVPFAGNYNIELWGAQGGSTAGFGGYTMGKIYLTANTNLYVYVGQKGSYGTFGINATSTVGKGAAATFNGGGAGGNAGGGSYPYSNYQGGSSGGGATDIRLISGTWQTVSSLQSRIMVAGGGGGGNEENVNYDNDKGSAGGLIGEKGGLNSFLIGKSVYATDVTKRGAGGTQTTGFAFGIGGTGDNSGLTTYCSGHSGAGGGYYGGNGGKQTGGNCHIIGGGAGSSFISGYTGCNAINADGTHTGQPNHYSGFVFSNSTMIAGNASMPTYDSLSTMIGNTGNGYIKISYLGQ